MRTKSLISSAVAIVVGICVLVFSHTVYAKVTSYGKWASATKTLYVASSSASTPWGTGANKWKNNTNFKVSTTLGTSSTYYAYDVNKSDVNWDGITTRTVSNGIITKATLSTNTYYTLDPYFDYTSSVLSGLTGHEIGHSLGLNDTSAIEVGSIMNPFTFNADNEPQRALNPSSSDISVVNSLYPAIPTASVSSTQTFLEDGIYISTSWVTYYKDEEELSRAADLVIRGKVIKDKGRKFKKGDYSEYFTESNVEIIEVLKGDQSPGQTITLSQMGGSDGEVTVRADNTTHLKKNQEVILFLRKIEDDKFIPINEDYGVFVNDGKSFKNISSNSELNRNNIK